LIPKTYVEFQELSITIRYVYAQIYFESVFAWRPGANAM